MSAPANTASKAAVNLLSRSRIKNVNWAAWSPRSMSRLRACDRANPLETFVGVLGPHLQHQTGLLVQVVDVGLLRSCPTAEDRPASPRSARRLAARPALGRVPYEAWLDRTGGRC